MSTLTGKRTASRKAHITKRAVDALQPAEKPYIAWDDRLTGLRRPCPAVRNQVLHPQLPPRSRRAQGTQPAHRPRTLRSPLNGQAHGADARGSRWRMTASGARRVARPVPCSGPSRSISSPERKLQHDRLLAPSARIWPASQHLDTISRKDQCFNRLSVRGRMGRRRSAALYRRQCVDVQVLRHVLQSPPGGISTASAAAAPAVRQVLPRWHRLASRPGFATVTRRPGPLHRHALLRGVRRRWTRWTSRR